jgi:hypothetical protein
VTTDKRLGAAGGGREAQITINNLTTLLLSSDFELEERGKRIRINDNNNSTIMVLSVDN